MAENQVPLLMFSCLLVTYMRGIWSCDALIKKLCINFVGKCWVAKRKELAWQYVLAIENTLLQDDH